MRYGDDADERWARLNRAADRGREERIQSGIPFRCSRCKRNLDDPPRRFMDHSGGLKMCLDCWGSWAQ